MAEAAEEENMWAFIIAMTYILDKFLSITAFIVKLPVFTHHSDWLYITDRVSIAWLSHVYCIHVCVCVRARVCMCDDVFISIHLFLCCIESNRIESNWIAFTHRIENVQSMDGQGAGQIRQLSTSVGSRKSLEKWISVRLHKTGLNIHPAGISTLLLLHTLTNKNICSNRICSIIPSCV